MSSPQPSKRQRPNRATACDACQRRKSRCELIQLDGCLRCRTLGTECSVARYGSNGPHELAAGASFTASEHEHALSSGPEELVGLLREMSGRMARMEQEMTELRQAVHRTPSSYASTFDARRGCNLQRKLDERARGIPGLQGALAMTPAGMISRALVWDARSCNFEPVGACLMGEADWRGAMHRVQQHASNFTPMSLPVDSTNSFFRLAIFVFDSILYPSSDCDTHTRTAISHLHHNPDPHLHAMIGLYLLSFLPLHTNRGVVDEYNGAARAYRMAREIGLDVSSLGLIGAGPLEDHRSIWEVILVRHETVSMLSSATLRPDPSTGPANDCAAVLPPLLWLERAMLNEIQGIASLLVRLRCAEQHEPLTVVELESAINAFVHNSTWMQQASALTSSAFFILSRHLYTMSICLKISTDAPDLLPSPLNYDDRFGLIKCTAPNIVHGARKTIDFVAAHPGFDLRGLPAFHMMLCLTAYKAMHQSSLADHGASASTTPSSGTASNFALFKQKLEQSSPQVRRIVEGIDRHDGPDSSWREAMSHDALWEGLLADFGADELLFWPDFVGPDNFSFQY